MAYDKIVDSTVLDGYFEDIADAIRAKDGSQATLAPGAMAQAIANIPSGGGNEALLALLAGTATGAVTIGDLEDLGFTQIVFMNYDSTFCSNEGVTSLTLSDLVDAGISSQFQNHMLGGIKGNNSNTSAYYSTALAEIHLPEALSIAIYDGYGTTFRNLEEIDAPKLTEAMLYIQNSKIDTLSLPAITNIRGNFTNNSYLTTINLPECTSVDIEFGSNAALVNVSLPEAVTLKNNIFYNCTALESITLPKAKPAGTSKFNGCTSLEYVEFGTASGGSSFGSNYFNGCTSLATIVLRATDRIHSLSNASILANTSIASGNGYIYVPDSLKATYKTATNWATYANQFRSLEDYTVDGTVTGALDPTKI